MKKIYQDMIETFEEVVASKIFGEGISIEKLIFPSEKDIIEKCLVVKPSVAFMGQINAGKSSLANELIGGGTWLPVAPEPCTSRMVRLKYSKEPYKLKIPFQGDPEEKKKLKSPRPTVEDIRLSDREKENPKVLEVELVFGVPNIHLYPDLEIIDLPGWSEREALNTVIERALEKISSPVLLPIYVLDGNQTVTTVDRQFIELLSKKFKPNRVLFVCNKIDHVEEKLHINYGYNGKLSVSEDGAAVYTVDDRKVELLNKAQATRQSLTDFGFVPDSETATTYNTPGYYSVSAGMLKANRTSPDIDVSDQFKYCQRQYHDFTNHLRSRLDRILVQHVLSICRTANAIVSRFAEGALEHVAVIPEASSDRGMADILEAGAKEEESYSECVQFLTKETETIKDLVLESFSAARSRIIERATKIRRQDIRGIENTEELHVSMLFLMVIADMAKRVVQHEIASRIVALKEQYVKSFNLLTQGIMNVAGFIRNVYLNSAIGSITITTVRLSNDSMEAGLEIFSLVPEAARCTINELFPDRLTLSDRVLDQVTAAALQLVEMNDEWKESITKSYLSTVKVDKLAPAIVEHCRQKMEEKHDQFVQSHEQMVALRKALLASQENNQRLRTRITCSIALLLLRLHALQCALEKGEPLTEDHIGEGRHCTVSTCPSWSDMTTPNTLVVKTFKPLSEDLWDEIALSFYTTRALEGNAETHTYVVRVYGALIIPTAGESKDRQLVLVTERRESTLPEALKQGLVESERYLIALDVALALSFLHKKSLVFGNLTASSVSLGRQKRAKLDVMKLRPQGEDSWLGGPSFHRAPELYLDENPTTSTSTDVYSFGMLLWEILDGSQRRPACYADCTNSEDMKRKVCDESHRPSKPDHVTEEWYGIMQDCWKKPDDRPSMENVTAKIESLVYPFKPKKDTLLT